MRDLDRPRDRIKRHARRLGGELHAAVHVEEGEIAGDQMVRDAGGLVEHVDLPADDVFRLLAGVVQGVGGAALDLVEARGEVGGRVGGLGADAVEVGDGGVFAGGEGDVLGCGALDDGERDELVGHYVVRRRWLARKERGGGG